MRVSHHPHLFPSPLHRLGAGASEDEAWEAFREAEAEAREFEKLVTTAADVGVDTAALPADTLTITEAIAVARVSRAAAKFEAMPLAVRHVHAVVTIQRLMRGVSARRRVARNENKRWLPRRDEETGHFYYTNVETGETRWAPPRHLPAAHVTLKVVCSACAAALAAVQCTTCEEAYCDNCSSALHVMPAARLRHRVFELPTAGSPASAFAAHAALAPLTSFPGGATLATAAAIERAFAGPHDGVCISCDTRVGTRYCVKCEVLYCVMCWPAMHARGSRKDHVPFSVFVATQKADDR